MSANHRFLKFCRTVHLYLGVFTAPAVLFFAITGGLQTFSLHETTRGSSYTPPAWLATVALLHKKQTTTAPPKRPPVEKKALMAESSAVAPAPGGSAGLALKRNDMQVTDAGKAGPNASPANSPDGLDRGGPKKNLLPMKLFFALVAVALAISTLTGIYMAYRYSRKPRLVSGILALGVLVPVALLLI